MSKRKKRLERLRRNPKNVRPEELDSVLKEFGFIPDFSAGSHVAYRHPSGVRITVAAHGQHVPSYIVKQALKAIDMLAINDEDETEDGEG
jgi:predicted RNA binding protein YcfA (HicA-like mRNA interferase family)